ncbi:MAG: DUF2288 domain-containing protein [Gammaproteobacteria bacterium]|nr:DUF2288 domain-containing protein [Gammaproteobacteria bacterium]
MTESQDQNLERHKLNLETGQITWKELERFFARGVLIVINSELDLVNAAQAFSLDDKETVEDWIKTGLVVRAHDEHAKKWNQTQAHFWSVVVAPWVLVQEITVQ